MTAIIIPRRHLAQPQGRVTVDWANPLANSLLVAATPLSEMAVQPEIKAGSIGLGARAGVLKRGAVTHGLANSTVFIVSQPLLPDNGSWWSGNGTIYADTSGAWPNDIGLRVLPPKVYGRISVASRATNGTVYAADVDVLDGGQSFGGVFTGAATVASDLLVTGFGGGKRWGTATDLKGYSYNTPPPTAPGPIFGQLASAAGPMDFLSLVFRWGRVLSDEEIFEVERNPWQLFRADPVCIYSLPSAGTEQALAASGSATATGTAQLAASIALAGVGVALATGSGTLSGAQSAPLAASGTATASGAAAPRIDIALSALGLSIATGTATLDTAAAGSLAASGSASAGGSAAVAANVTISAAGLAQAAAAAGLSAQALLAGAGAAAAAGNAALAAQLRAAATGGAQASGTATITGSAAGQIWAGGSAQALGSAALVVSVRLAAAGSAAATGAAAVDGGASQALAASGQAGATGAAQVVADVVLTGAGFVQAMGVGYLVVQVPLQATGGATAAGAAAAIDGEALVLIYNPHFAVFSDNPAFEVFAHGRRFEVSRR